MQELKCDVLIVGSGGAGLKTASVLHKAGVKKILIVGDRPLTDPHTVLAAGGINAALASMDPEDSWEHHAFDTFVEGQNLADPYMVEIMARKAPEAIEDLIKIGAKFNTEEDGRLTQRFFGAHSYRRTIFAGDETGKEIIRVLSQEILKQEIQFIENTHIFKLVGDKDGVHGAIGIKNNELMCIKSGTIVLATGGYSKLYLRSSSRKRENYGVGIALAYDLGATVADMEMVQFHPTGLINPAKFEGVLLTEALRAEGAILVNALGERFMSRYDSKRMELSTRDIVARANFSELKLGNGTQRGGVFLDITSKTPKELKEKVPHIYKFMKERCGVDMTRERVEVAPTAHYTMGGLHVDPESGQCDVKGLYAVGECTTGMHGANRLGGNSLAEILIYGKIVAEHLAESRFRKPKGSDAAFKSALNDIEKSLSRDGEVYPKIVLNEVRDLMWKKVGIVRRGDEMESALEHFDQLQERVEKEGMLNYSSLSQSITRKTRAKSVLKLAQLVTRSALERRESRGAHFRSDYTSLIPNFEQNILIKKEKLSIKKVRKPSAAMKKILEKFSKTSNYTHLE